MDTPSNVCAMDTSYLTAETDSEDYAARTGLIAGRGFVIDGGRPTGLYPTAMAARIMGQLAGVTVHVTPARTYNEGRSKLAHLFV